MCGRKLSPQPISLQPLKYTSEATSMKMKLILVLVIVFSLDILTMLAETKFPQHEEKDTPAMNVHVSSINDAALNKRAVGKHCSGTYYCIERFSLNIALRGQGGVV